MRPVVCFWGLRLQPGPHVLAHVGQRPGGIEGRSLRPVPGSSVCTCMRWGAGNCIGVGVRTEGCVSGGPVPGAAVHPACAGRCQQREVPSPGLIPMEHWEAPSEPPSQAGTLLGSVVIGEP